MRSLAFVPAALVAAGLALVVLAVAAGGARLDLVVIVPVVSGSSALFLAGVLLLVLGLFSLPFALAAGSADDNDPAPLPGRPSAGPSGAGGVVLIGPVPIFFGTWKGLSRRARWAAVAVGAAITALAVTLVLVAR